MESTQNVEKAVIEIAAKIGCVDPSEITAETAFMADLNFDSLDMVEMVMQLEDQFQATISEEAVEEIRTVGQAVDYIRAQVPAA